MAQIGTGDVEVTLQAKHYMELSDYYSSSTLFPKRARGIHSLSTGTVEARW